MLLLSSVSLRQLEDRGERERVEMALYRLLHLKSRLHLQRVGLTNTTRCCYCTSSHGGKTEKSSQSKKTVLAKEQKAAAVESFVKQYMEAHQGILPKISHVQNRLGGSWYTLKDIFTNTKEKVLGNSQFPNHTTNDTSDSAVGATASDVFTSHSNHDISELAEGKSTVITSEFCEDNISSTAMSCIEGGNLTKSLTNAKDSQSFQSCINANHTALEEAEVVSLGNEKSISTSAASHIRREKSSEDRSRLDNISDGLKRVESEEGNIKLDREFLGLISSLGDQKTMTEKLSSGGLRSASSGGTQKLMGISGDHFMKRMNGQRASEKVDSVGPGSFEFSNGTPQRGPEQSVDVKVLIDRLKVLDCLKVLPEDQSFSRSHDSITSYKTDQTINKGAMRGTQSEANRQRMENKSRKTINMNCEGRGVDVAAFECIKSKPSPKVPFLTSKQGLEVSDENKVLVWFLHKPSVRSDIEQIFNDCGCITKIEVPATRSFFKTATIYFKTKEGMQKALEKTEAIVRNMNVIEEAASSADKNPNKTLIPDLIGYPDVPTSLVKNPTRTVMIKQLTPEIRLSDIKEALAFGGSNVSGLFIGSSSSVAYVEFETEEGKQRALERCSISVSGKQLLIFRIDAPRTTVVRISNHHQYSEAKFKNICGTYGEVNRVILRSGNFVDVHFKLAEWPNMLKILNRLNGLEVGGSRWIAQPAPVFPPKVVRVLWSHPDGRQHLKTQIDTLLRKLEESPSATQLGLTSMTYEYYRMAESE